MDRSHTLKTGSSSTGASSSATHAQARRFPSTHHSTGADDIDPFSTETDDAAILADDPLHDTIDESVSFRRTQRRADGVLSQPLRLIPGLAGWGKGGGSDGRLGPPSSSRGHDGGAGSSSASSSSGGSGSSPLGGLRLSRDRGGNAHPNNNNGSGSSNFKGGLSQDWYVEGPGRRVGYEDLTAIDWIFEYTKERQRLRVLYSQASGLLGFLPHLLDASQVWVILLLTGLAVGTVAAAIDVTTDWLGDLKTGYCASGPDGGAFYLNKGFCCFGYDEWSKCVGWRPWAAALGISSAGGKWFIEYFFFALFSVHRPIWLPIAAFFFGFLLTSCVRSPSRSAPTSSSRSTPCMPSTAASRK